MIDGRVRIFYWAFSATHHTANDSDIRMYFKEKQNDEIQK